MKRETREIHHPSQLVGLTVWRTLRARSLGPIHIAGKDVTPERARMWERQLNTLQRACGCEAAGMGLAVGLAIAVIAWWSSDAAVTTGVAVARGLVIVFAAAIIGKGVGLWRAQQRLNRLISEIRGEWQAPPLGYSERTVCG